MAFTDAMDVDIGDPTKASDYDTLADNTEFNREKADVDHDFDITTGDGYHNAEPTACFHLVSVADSVSASVFLDADGYPRIKINNASVTPPVPANNDDGQIMMVPTDAKEGGFDEEL